jgi:peroxidase
LILYLRNKIPYNHFRDVDDIDLYVGGLSETPINGGLLGPIFSCIVALQFRDFKKGDRYFYESGPSATAFSKGKNKI